MPQSPFLTKQLLAGKFLLGDNTGKMNLSPFSCDYYGVFFVVVVLVILLFAVLLKLSGICSSLELFLFMDNCLVVLFGRGQES